MLYINKIKGSIFYITTFIIYATYLAIFLGISFIRPEYLQTSMHIMEFFICLILIIRFHPFKEAKMEKYDQQIIFLSATILLTNLGYTNYFINTAKKSVTNHIISLPNSEKI
jgi:hypothetical protein